MGNPILIIFSDGSNDDMARVLMLDGDFVMKTTKPTSSCPKTALRLPRNYQSTGESSVVSGGAVLNKRLKTTITEQCRYRFEKCYHIADSQIVHSIIQKESYGFNTFAPVRVGEIQEGTNTKDWYWTASEFNVADLLTRGSKPNDIDIYKQ